MDAKLVSRRLGLPLARTPEQVRISQAFGVNPEAYARFGLAGHNGLDLEAEEGELVLAMDGGEIVELRLDRAGYGLTIKLAHSWGESRYAHGQRQSVPIDFTLGHVVRKGERLFLASGGHVHVALRLMRDDGLLGYGSAGGFGGWDDPLPLLADGLGLEKAEPARNVPGSSSANAASPAALAVRVGPGESHMPLRGTTIDENRASPRLFSGQGWGEGATSNGATSRARRRAR